MHKVAAQAEAAVSIPLLHIADATADQLKLDGIETVGLHGNPFYDGAGFLQRSFNRKSCIRVLVPNENAQEVVHRVIYEELCLGKISNTSRTSVRADN